MSLLLFSIFGSFSLIILFYNSKKLSVVTGLYKKTHDNTPLTGGLGIYLFFILGLISYYFNDHNLIKENFYLIFFISLIFFCWINRRHI